LIGLKVAVLNLRPASVNMDVDLPDQSEEKYVGQKLRTMRSGGAEPSLTAQHDPSLGNGIH